MKISALIPVRSGSKRVKNKNVRPFIGSSLLEIKIKQMLRIKEAGFIDEVVVNSNSDEMLEIARQLGAKMVKRDEYFVLDLTPNEEIYENYAKNLDCDVVCFCDVTNPLIKDETILRAISLYKNLEQEFDSVVSANVVRLFMYKDGKTLNYDENHKPRSQDLPLILALNYTIHILKKDFMLKHKRIVGFKPYLFEIDKMEALDIDENLDFEIAEILYSKFYIEGK
ncbi:acylneuraminate cytidylyltransferase family protein [Campylobacter jejuni]|nr:acylneuraminate cytidylyltransferase family protein [Campylobacter jejuni]ECQ7461239.1 acylneuraminate cytidylyltransferase family protein [Campylobacter jejuni]ECQ9162215.1 acylneuraminate cytidylyltransferase family protein [Campylobacter jejuni]EDP4524846.1 acylneuraminate cytidylyltransferase family protein [Campylobacter jejuni]